jgi:hypothetical protein
LVGYLGQAGAVVLNNTSEIAPINDRRDSLEELLFQEIITRREQLITDYQLFANTVLALHLLPDPHDP